MRSQRGRRCFHIVPRRQIPFTPEEVLVVIRRIFEDQHLLEAATIQIEQLDLSDQWLDWFVEAGLALEDLECVDPGMDELVGLELDRLVFHTVNLRDDPSRLRRLTFNPSEDRALSETLQLLLDHINRCEKCAMLVDVHQAFFCLVVKLVANHPDLVRSLVDRATM